RGPRFTGTHRPAGATEGTASRTDYDRLAHAVTSVASLSDGFRSKIGAGRIARTPQEADEQGYPALQLSIRRHKRATGRLVPGGWIRARIHDHADPCAGRPGRVCGRPRR